MNDVSGKLPPFGFGGLVDSSRAQMNDGKGEFPSFGLGGPFDSSRTQEQRHRHMLAQALSNWRKEKRGRPKAPWRENLFPAISRTMDSHPDKTDTERALIISDKLRPKVKHWRVNPNVLITAMASSASVSLPPKSRSRDRPSVTIQPFWF